MVLPKVFKNGFTMIELLVVIAVIGILAVALLATLNPLEQIKKGRDTRTRSDVSQLTSAIERYNASLGYFPWQASESENLSNGSADINFIAINSAVAVAGCSLGVGNCTIDKILGQLTSTSEVKSSFIDRITDAGYNDIYLYYNDESSGAAVYGCFTPESNTFQREAFDRCKANEWGTDFPSTLVYSTSGPCPDSGGASTYATAPFNPGSVNEMICLP